MGNKKGSRGELVINGNTMDERTIIVSISWIVGSDPVT